MKKRISAIFVTIAIILCFINQSLYAAETKEIFISPASEVEGVVWDIVTCEHSAPENIHNDGTLQIGWGKDGDIIKLVDEVDFGKGLVSAKAMITYAGTVPEGAKMVAKAGDTIIAEFVPVSTASWADPAEIKGTLKEPVKGKQVVTFEWVDNSCGFGDITFVVTPDTTAPGNQNTTNPQATANSSSPAVSGTSSSASASAKTSAVNSLSTNNTSSTPKVSSTINNNDTKSKNNTNLIVGICAGVLILGGGITAVIIYIKKK